MWAVYHCGEYFSFNVPEGVRGYYHNKSILIDKDALCLSGNILQSAKEGVSSTWNLMFGPGKGRFCVLNMNMKKS